MTQPLETGEPGEVLKRGFTIKVIGVGGGGCNAVSHLAGETFEGMSFALMNTDGAALAQSSVKTKVVLGAKLMRGLGTGGDPELGRASAEEGLQRIRELCAGADIVFIAAGLGGGTGTGASPVVARAARETGALVLAIVMLPFECEGGRRQRQAQRGLQALKEAADGVICVPNQKLLKFIDEQTSLLEAFSITNELLAQGVRGIWRLLAKPGLINVDFADLCAVTRGQHGESTLAAAEAKGENRSRQVIVKLLALPLLDDGQVLNGAEGVLVSLAGGPDMTMAEVNRVMEQINRASENAHIIMGAAIDEEFRGRLLVTLVASQPSEQPEGDRPRALLAKNRSDESAVSAGPDLEAELADPEIATRPASRFVAPPPPSTPEKTERLLTQQSGNGRQRRKAARLRQGQLPLEIISKGRFEKSEPTICQGQDLDVPTYIRRGVALN
ncbi:MAG: cell division protein FtsZ [Verrucomicrobia bacterium]|nr:MAG: cell division protein FtsZ [Verrucomicrobiota bacterium]